METVGFQREVQLLKRREAQARVIGLLAGQVIRNPNGASSVVYLAALTSDVPISSFFKHETSRCDERYERDIPGLYAPPMIPDESRVKAFPLQEDR